MIFLTCQVKIVPQKKVAMVQMDNTTSVSFIMDHLYGREVLGSVINLRLVFWVSKHSSLSSVSKYENINGVSPELLADGSPVC